jgi:hypothetical protein
MTSAWGSDRGIREHNQGNNDAWWGHPPGSLPEHPQPNQALHLTASSVRSCVASAFGSR